VVYWFWRSWHAVPIERMMLRHSAPGLRPYNLQSVQDPGSQPIELNKQQPVDAAEGHSLRGFATQDVELVSKNKDFDFQRSPRPEQPDQAAPDQSAKIAHRWDYQPIRERQSAVLGLR
jgi:hypothetical protein